MKRTDLIAIVIGVGLALFFALQAGRQLYETAYGRLPLVITFVKFALLATGGEILAHRIRTGRYQVRGFGTIPKMIVWGVLGLAIYAAFGIFSAGVPALFEQLLARLNETAVVHDAAVVRALLISVFMNVFFAPVMMLTHHVTDGYISAHGGHFPLKGMRLLPAFERIDWNRMWGFVFARTIPLFWIPAHTVTFLLPAAYRTIFAAVLSVVLGLFLGVAARQKEVADG